MEVDRAINPIDIPKYCATVNMFNLSDIVHFVSQGFPSNDLVEIEVSGKLMNEIVINDYLYHNDNKQYIIQ